MNNRVPIDWNTMSHLLAVAESGSLLAASKRIDVSQPTLSREVQRLERRLRTRLFVRTQAGLRPTEAGQRLLAAAGRMEEEVLSAEASLGATNEHLQGIVRISTTDGIGAIWLVPKLRAFKEQIPGLCVELSLDNETVSLPRATDVAIRVRSPAAEAVVARKAGQARLGWYAANRYVRRHGSPKKPADLRDHSLVLATGIWGNVKDDVNERLQRLVDPDRVTFRSDSTLARLAAVKAGLGIGTFACFTCRGEKTVRRVLPQTSITWDIYVVTHPLTRANIRIRRTVEFLMDVIASSKDELMTGG